jgi:hypothetical protein
VAARRATHVPSASERPSDRGRVTNAKIDQGAGQSATRARRFSRCVDELLGSIEPLARHVPLKTGDRVRSAGTRGVGAAWCVGGSVRDTFVAGPSRHEARTQTVKAALPSTDDERVPGHARAKVVREPRREIETDRGSERLARPQPHERLLAAHAIAYGIELRSKGVARRERTCVEDLVLHENATPLAVAPVLDLGDGTRRLIGCEPIERLGPARDASRGIESPERPIQRRSERPRRGETDEGTDARPIVREEPQWLEHR